MNSRKDKLLVIKEELTQRVEKIDKDLHSRKTSEKFDEQVVDRQNDDVLLNLKNRSQLELEMIADALLKIENKAYGICEKCQGTISAERLDAIPYAAQCKDCAQ
jgi:DnaK suppressor protein